MKKYFNMIIFKLENQKLYFRSTIFRFQNILWNLQILNVGPTLLSTLTAAWVCPTPIP